LERLVSLRGGVSQEDSAYYFLETDLRIKRELVNTDFMKLFVLGDSTADIMLQSEDYIMIPPRRGTIYVFGQVRSPGNVAFMTGADADYYVNQAGGFTDVAREGDVRIIKAATRQWLNPDETQIDEGDYVWVPREPERSFAYYMTIASQTASVLSVIIGIAVLAVQASK
jgi:hypothetical protein